MVIDQSGNYFHKFKSVLQVLPKKVVILWESEAPLVWLEVGSLGQLATV